MDAEAEAAALALAPQAAGRQLLSVAPMMDWTDVHFRQLARLLSKRTVLWTEMVEDKTVLHAHNLDKHLWFPPEQRPLVLQLGGSDPTTLAAAAARAVSYGYDEINLNCGCPSDRVAGAGCFGTALMMQPALVGECLAAVAEAVERATAELAAGGAGAEGGRGERQRAALEPQRQARPRRCRLGVDDADSYEQLVEFVRVVSERAPVRHFVVHSRKAFLNGLSPHQNRTVPPLRHQWAWALARDFPHLQFSLNGGLQTAHEGRSALLTAHPAVPYTRPRPDPSHPAAAAASVAATPDFAALATTSSTPTPIMLCAFRLQPQRTPRPRTPDPIMDTVAVCTFSGNPINHSTLSRLSASNTPTPSSTPLPTNGGGIEGVMIGRGAYNDPWGCLADADRAVWGEEANPATSRREVIAAYREYAESMHGRWSVKADGHHDPSVRTLMRPLLNLFRGEGGCKRWKAAVDEVLKAGAGSIGEVLDATPPFLSAEVLDAPPRQPDLAALPAFPLDPELPAPSSRAGQNQDPPGAARAGGGQGKAGKGKGKKKKDKGASGAESGSGNGHAAASVDEAGEGEGAGAEGRVAVGCCAEAAAEAAEAAARAEAEESDGEGAGGSASAGRGGAGLGSTVGGVVAAAGAAAPQRAVATAAAGSGGERRRRRGCIVS
ncbi:hypothetical protein HYH03_012224 [Edaphochlamys debaryana]|uniref:DUS-like FMN-binding domain-containing protein n=1 Tax=Edaphochlamys debaryana TaxID=47281 RepID=A0A835Y134_9CHLO|nr:hypothetical protein HYH03_012224 [Edaphochlamys debaryana]|eukprot:KAG2489199.1 hypothetical protein HYH03_012224 [Edaphochlamys debaryana]